MFKNCRDWAISSEASRNRRTFIDYPVREYININGKGRYIMKRQILFDVISPQDLNKCGVYKITNKINNHFYIGSTCRSFKERMLEHCACCIQNKNGSPVLYNAFRKYGFNNFYVEFIEIMNKATELQIHEREGFYIRTFNPQYNICREPEVSGSPNKGRKLTKEWKENIAKKSAQYTHSKEVYKKVVQNNKNNSCKLIFQNDNEILTFNSWIEASKYLSGNKTAMMSAYKKNKPYKGYTIIKKTTQKKSLIVYTENGNLKFKSFNECDRFFNMWRGYTSTQYTRNRLILDKYHFNVI